MSSNIEDLIKNEQINEKNSWRSANLFEKQRI